VFNSCQCRYPLRSPCCGVQVGASEAALLGKLGVKPFKYGLEVLKVYEGGSLFDVAVLDITDEDLMGAVGAGLANVAALSMAANYPTLASIPHSVINGYKNVLAIALETDYSFPLADKVREGTQAADAAAAADADAMAICRWRAKLLLAVVVARGLCASAAAALHMPCLYQHVVKADGVMVVLLLLLLLQVKEYLKNPGAFAVAAAPAAAAGGSAPAAAAAPVEEEEEEEDMGFSLFD
jgi:hypothetical protein